jgi:tight adherence protein B
MPEPLAFEFGRVFEEVRFGKEWRDALNALIDRNPTVFDLRLFVSSVLLQRETGGNMIETLANIANTIRSRYVFDAKVAAMTAEARTSGFVLAGMPAGVILMIVLANAEYLDPLIYDPLGNAIVMLCVCMYGFGLYIMKIASQVEV